MCHVVVVEDDKDIRSAIAHHVRNAGIPAPLAYDSIGEAINDARQAPEDWAGALLLLDAKVPEPKQGPERFAWELLGELQTLGVLRTCAVIVLTAYGKTPAVREQLQPFEDALLFRIVEKPLTRDHLWEALLRAGAELVKVNGRLRSHVLHLVGESEAIRQLRVLVLKAACNKKRNTVLIGGEPGVGKECVARAIHKAEEVFLDRKMPFDKVDCGALSETLLQDELFGHEKGAFSGAERPRRGAFERAHGGILFLDEIGNMSLAAQQQLLSVLQDREFRRLGAEKPIQVDLRVIAATNADLAKGVGQHAFREDLYYRLQDLPITIPPLRERREDIAPLVESLLQENDELRSATPDAIAALAAYPWPGNVRELQNLLSQAQVRFQTRLTLDADMVAALLPPAPAPPSGYEEAVERHKVKLVVDALARNNYNVTKAAAELGVARKTVYDQLRHGRDRGWVEKEVSECSA